MTPDAPPLRRADLGRAAEVTADAFIDYESYTPMLPEREHRRRVLRYLHRVLFRYGLAWGEVHAAPDLAGVAFWMPARNPWFGHVGMAWQGMLGLPFVAGWSAFRRMLRYFDFLDSTRLKLLPGPHAYLCVLAVDPARQRSGVGGALLRPSLQRLDAAGTVAYLETATPANVAYYERFGFRVVDDSVGPDAIRTWGMRRDPRAGP